MAMASTPEELFRYAAGKVFNCWSALQLAVEHGMGGPQGYSKAMGLIDTVVELFKSKPDAGWDEVADLLGDTMDDEFNTICEDDSTDEVGLLLWEFYKHCCSGDRDLVEAEIAKLPSGNWLSKCINQSQPQNFNLGNSQDDDDEDDDDDDDEEDDDEGGPSTSNGHHQMNQEADPDPGWTQVNRRRR